MNLQPNDLHAVFMRGPNRLKLFRSDGSLVLNVECRNRTVKDGSYGHWGNCPPGSFLLGKPTLANTVPFGKWFVAMRDYPGSAVMKAYRRSGIGIHGGGSGLPDPYAPKQGWVITHGCLRLQNIDLETLVAQISFCQRAKGSAYITVEEPVPYAPAEGEQPPEPYTDVPVDELAPGE